MPAPRKLFSQLSDSQRKRKLSWYRRNQGLSPSQVARRYNAGTLGSQKAARGKAESPEHKIQPDTATPKQREQYKRYFGRQEGEVYILTTEGLKVYPRGEISIKDEKLIGGHWGKIGRALEGDPIAIQDIPTFKRAKRVGGYGQIPKMSLEYRIDEIEQAAARGVLPDKPFTIGSD